MKLTPKRRAADLRLRREFGITLEEYDMILAYQGKRCAICKQPATHFTVRLSVDHCHKIGLLRGLLCHCCNKALGAFFDDLARLKAAVEYLTLPPVTGLFFQERFTAPGRVGSKRRAKLLKQMKQEKREQ